MHKSLLAATSDYFHVMFLGMMAESRQDAVDLKGVTASGLQQVLDFLYSGQLALQYDNLADVINTADHLQVDSALVVCSRYIIAQLTFTNAEEFLAIADTYSLTMVLSHWEDMIFQNFSEFSQCDVCLKLDADKMANLLTSDRLKISSEYKLLKCLSKWFLYDPMRYSTGSEKILAHIRFPLMSKQELASLRDCDIIMKCPHSTRLVDVGNRYHVTSRAQPLINELSTIRSEKSSLVLVHGTSHMPLQITAYNSQSKQFYRLFSDVNGSRDCRVVVVDNFMYICRIMDCGGGTLMSALFRFDPRHLTKQDLNPMRTLRLDFAMLAHRQHLYVFGGSTERFTILDCVECYNTATDEWQVLSELPSATHSLAAVVSMDLIYLSGGVSGRDRQSMNTFVCYDPVARSWDQQPGFFYARRLHDMVAHNDNIYIFGGIPKPGVLMNGNIPIERFSHKTNQWTILSSTLYGRSLGHYINYEGLILSLGHEYQEALDYEVWHYDDASDKWTNYAKGPQKMSLTSAICAQLKVNFHDEKIAAKFIKEA